MGYRRNESCACDDDGMHAKTAHSSVMWSFSARLEASSSSLVSDALVVVVLLFLSLSFSNKSFSSASSKTKTPNRLPVAYDKTMTNRSCGRRMNRCGEWSWCGLSCCCCCCCCCCDGMGRLTKGSHEEPAAVVVVAPCRRCPNDAPPKIRIGFIMVECSVFGWSGQDRPCEMIDDPIGSIKKWVGSWKCGGGDARKRDCPFSMGYESTSVLRAIHFTNDNFRQEKRDGTMAEGGDSQHNHSDTDKESYKLTGDDAGESSCLLSSPLNYGIFVLLGRYLLEARQFLSSGLTIHHVKAASFHSALPSSSSCSW